MRLPLTPVAALEADARSLQLRDASIASPNAASVPTLHGDGADDGDEWTQEPDPALAAWFQVASILRRLRDLDVAARKDYARVVAVQLQARRARSRTRTASGGGARSRPGPEARSGEQQPSSAEPDLRALGEAVGSWDGDRVPEAAARLVQRIVEQMERYGAFNLAFTALSALAALFGEVAVPLRGHVYAQMGRIARQMGDLAAAEELYALAGAVGRAARDREVSARAQLGLGVVFGQRGNYPAARAAYQRAIEQAPPDSPIAMGASHGLMLAAWAADDFDTALHHGWRAFASSHASAEQRAEALINLGALCRSVGHPAAALRAFLVALTATELARLRLPALRGAVLAAGSLGHTAQMWQLIHRAEAEVHGGNQPYEAGFLWLDIAVALMSRGDDRAADAYAARAVDVAAQYGFAELRWRAEELRQQVAQHEEASAPREGARRQTATVPPGSQVTDVVLTDASRAVVAEIAALPFDERLLATAERV